MDIVTFKTEMDSQLINCIIHPVVPLVKVIDQFVGGSLRIHHNQTLGEGHVKLLRGKFGELCNLCSNEKYLGFFIFLLRDNSLNLLNLGFLSSFFLDHLERVPS